MLHVVICGENTQFSAVLSTQCCVDCSHWAVHLGHSVTQFCPSVSWHMVGDSESVEKLQDSMLSKYGPWLLSWQLLLIPRHALSPSHTKFCGRPRGALCPGACSLSWSLGERFLCGNRKAGASAQSSRSPGLCLRFLYPWLGVGMKPVQALPGTADPWDMRCKQQTKSL